MLKKLFAGSESLPIQPHHQSPSGDNYPSRKPPDYKLHSDQSKSSHSRRNSSFGSVPSPLSPSQSHSHSHPHPNTFASISASSLYSTNSNSSTTSASACPPISVIDEADTRNLLYGATNLGSTNLASINGSRDIRVVIISDSPRLDIPFYDSHNVSQDLAYPTQTPSIAIASHRRPSLSSTSPGLKHASMQSQKANLYSQQKYAAEIPNFSSLQTRVFGLSHMKYNGPGTKLHPLPLTEYSHNDRRNSNSSINSASNGLPSSYNSSYSHSSSNYGPARPKQVWLVSRIFRLSKQDKANTVSTTTETTTAASSFHSFIPESFQKHFTFGGNGPYHTKTITTKSVVTNSLPNLSSSVPSGSNIQDRTTSRPSSSQNASQNPPTSGPILSDYNVAICVFITVPHDSQSYVTDYWEELTAALLQLQLAVSKELLSTLPLLSREFIPSSYSEIEITSPSSFNQRMSSSVGSNNLNPPTSTRRNLSRFSQNGNLSIKHAIEAFRSRFLTSIRVPRVICGQQKWPELVQIFKSALISFGPGSEQFLCSMLSTFVLTNTELLSVDRRSFSATSLGSPPTRTVIVGGRIISRKIIFLLTSMINDSFNEIYDEQRRDLSALAAIEDSNDHDTDDDNKLFKPRSSSIANSISSFTTDSSNNDGPNSKITLAMGPRKLSEPSIEPLVDDSGWKCDVTTQNIVAESSSVCTMSHVFVPNSTSSSISSTLFMAIGGSNSNSNSANNYSYNNENNLSGSLGKSNGSAAYNLFGSLTRKNTFSFNNIRNSLSSISSKAHKDSSQRRPSTTRLHEDFVFHTSDDFAGSDFLSNNIANSMSIPPIHTSNLPYSSSFAIESPVHSLNPSLSSSFTQSSHMAKLNERTATTLPPLPQLVEIAASNRYASGIKNRKESVSTSGNTSPILSRCQMKPHRSGSISRNGLKKEHGASTTTLSTPKSQVNTISNTNNSTGASTPTSTIPRGSNEYPLFNIGDDSTASFFSTFVDSIENSNAIQIQSDSSVSSSGSDNSCSSGESLLTYESVEIPEKAASCIDVSPLELADVHVGPMFLEPIVLPPIVGHISDFHPDFAVQACLPSDDLSEKIRQAMLQDALSFKPDDTDVSTINAATAGGIGLGRSDSKSKGLNLAGLSTASSLMHSIASPLLSYSSSSSDSYNDRDDDYGNAKEIVSKTLVIDLENLEITEHILVRDSPTNQILYCNTLFSREKPVTPAIGEGMTTVESQLAPLISHTQKSSRVPSPDMMPLSRKSTNTIEDDTFSGKNQSKDIRTQKMDNYLSAPNPEKFEDILKRCYDSRFNLLNYMQ